MPDLEKTLPSDTHFCAKTATKVPILRSHRRVAENAVRALAALPSKSTNPNPGGYGACECLRVFTAMARHANWTPPGAGDRRPICGGEPWAAAAQGGIESVKREAASAPVHDAYAVTTAVRQDPESGDNWAAHRSGPKTS